MTDEQRQLVSMAQKILRKYIADESNRMYQSSYESEVLDNMRRANRALLDSLK